MGDRTESMRQLVDMAIQSGRKRLSPQTGYIHYCQQAQEEDTHLTIPLVENFLFALALLRSRTIENINEAKTLLDGLLHFQNCAKDSLGVGNFPVYMHEYPICKDRFNCVQISLAVYWMLKQFHQVLGSELKRRLEDAFSAMLIHCLKMHSEKAASYATALKIGTVCMAGGELLQRSDLKVEGEKILEHLRLHPDTVSWYCPAAMGAMLSSLTITYPRLKSSPWASFWQHLEETWHAGTNCYVGPAYKEWQYGEEPQVTLYDLFLGYLTGEFSARALQDNIVHLEGVLIPACEETFQLGPYPRQIDRSTDSEVWHMHQTAQMAFCYIEKSPELNPALIKGFQPLRIVWGDKQRVHTFVCQGGNSRKIEFLAMPGGLDMIFELGDVLETEDREKNRETVFFIDIHEGLETLIAGHKATTFALGEEITLRSGVCQLSLTFHLEEGDGRFLGHRMLGNRPSQMRLKGKQRYDAYDWQLFMRTIKRSELCVVKASLRLK